MPAAGQKLEEIKRSFKDCFDMQQVLLKEVINYIYFALF